VVQLVAEQLRVCKSMAGRQPSRAAKKAAKGGMAAAGAAAAPVAAAPAAAA
jgi:hypothetical protein